MIHYRALFSDLLGDPADVAPGPAATDPGQIIAADGMTAKDGDVYAAVARNATAAGDPAATRQQSNGSAAGDLTT